MYIKVIAPTFSQNSYYLVLSSIFYTRAQQVCLCVCGGGLILTPPYFFRHEGLAFTFLLPL